MKAAVCECLSEEVKGACDGFTFVLWSWDVSVSAEEIRRKTLHSGHLQTEAIKLRTRKSIGLAAACRPNFRFSDWKKIPNKAGSVEELPRSWLPSTHAVEGGVEFPSLGEGKAREESGEAHLQLNKTGQTHDRPTSE